MFEIVAVREMFNSFYSNYYSGEVPNAIISSTGELNAPAGHSLILANVLGRAVVVVLPSDVVSSNMIALVKADCSCKSGSAGCKANKIIGIGAYYCDEGCKSCSMTTSKFDSQGNESIITIDKPLY